MLSQRSQTGAILYITPFVSKLKKKKKTPRITEVRTVLTFWVVGRPENDNRGLLGFG